MLAKSAIDFGGLVVRIFERLIIAFKCFEESFINLLSSLLKSQLLYNFLYSDAQISFGSNLIHQLQQIKIIKIKRVRGFIHKKLQISLYKFIQNKNNMSLETWCMCINQQNYQKMKSLQLTKRSGMKESGNKEIIFPTKPKVGIDDQHKYINYLREHLAKSDERVFKSPNSLHSWEISKISLREFKQVRNIICSNSPKKLGRVKSPKKPDLKHMKTL